MIHPLLRLVATQPQLVADHAQAYAELVGEAVNKTTSRWKQRLVLQVIALALAAVAVVLAGVALMFWAAMAPGSIQAPWALVAAPALPAVVALVCAMSGRAQGPEAFDTVKAQLAADLVMLREAGSA